MEKLLGKLGFVLLLILIAGGGIFALTRKSKIAEGVETFSDQGRNHISAGSTQEYNSNPPTSGPHYAQWEKPGIYDRALEDGNLIHSLEHGYIIISYNCNVAKISNFEFQISNLAYAHETEEPHEEIPATDSAGIKPDNVSEWKNNPDCQKLVEQIKQVTRKTGMDRLIVVPRPELNSPIALTAWAKLMRLETVDENKIIEFVKKFRNKGPEKTME